MEGKIQKWGNSSGIRIPKHLLETLRLKNGDNVDINSSEDQIIITKSKKKNILQERIDAYEGPNKVDNFVWDEPVGRELW